MTTQLERFDIPQPRETSATAGPARLIEFESATELLQARSKCSDDKGWGGSCTKQRNALLDGDVDKDLVNMIDAAYARMSAAITMGEGYEMAPAGSYPLVPAAIAGDPMAMRRRVMRPEASAPVRIWLPVSTSCGLTQERYSEVITLAAAAAISLSESRPLSVMTYSCMDGKKGRGGKKSEAIFITCPIEVEAIDAKALAAWCDIYVGRLVHMSITKTIEDTWSGLWGWCQYPSDSSYDKSIREALEMPDEDILIPSAFNRSTVKNFMTRIGELAKQSGATLDMDILEAK